MSSEVILESHPQRNFDEKVDLNFSYCFENESLRQIRLEQNECSVCDITRIQPQVFQATIEVFVTHILNFFSYSISTAKIFQNGGGTLGRSRIRSVQVLGVIAVTKSRISLNLAGKEKGDGHPVK